MGQPKNAPNFSPVDKTMQFHFELHLPHVSAVTSDNAVRDVQMIASVFHGVKQMITLF